MFFIAGHYYGAEALGLLSIALSFVFIPINILDQSIEFGIIQTDDSLDLDHSSIVNVNLLISSAVLMIVLVVFFCFLNIGNDILLMTLTLCPILFLNAYITVNNAIHKRNLEFVKLAKMESFASISYLIIFLLFISLGCGIWSLVYAIIVKFLISFLSIFLFKYQSFSYRRDGSFINLNFLFRYSKYIIAERCFASVLSYMDVWILSIFLGIAPLGQFELLKKIILRPVLVIYGALENVSFSILVKAKENPQKFRRTHAQHSALSMFIFMNYFLIIGLNAKAIAKYISVSILVPYDLIIWVSVFGAIIILLNPLDILLYSLGLTKKFFYWMLSYSIPLIVISAWFAQWGVVSYLKAQIVIFLIIYIMAFFILIPKRLLSTLNYFIPLLYFLLVFTILNLIGFLHQNNCLLFSLLMIVVIAINTYLLYYIRKIELFNSF